MFLWLRDAVQFLWFNMSPKKAKSSKKGSKAQKAKLKQEEEERHQREEEEARIKAEKEQEQERLVRERKEKEQERLELKDQERREDELNHLRHLLEENHIAVTKWKTDAKERAKWQRYMCGDGTPNPSVQQDINTYISLWRDDPEVDITVVLEQCKLALKLVDELELLLRDVTQPHEGQIYEEGIVNLQEMIHFKHQLTTEEILKDASENIDTGTGNMQTVVRDENLTLCLWANLKKNRWFQGFTFQEVGLGFELPKQLAVRDIAVRLLHTSYDHLTLLARMSHLRSHTPSHRSLTGSIEVPGDIDESKQAAESGEGEMIENNKQQQEMVDEEVQSIIGSEGRKSVASLRSRSNMSQPIEGRASNIQTQMEALSAEGDLTSPPPQLVKMDHVVKVVDLMQYTPLGGVFYYDIFQLPPQAGHMNGWKIRQLLEGGLQVQPYPMEKSNVDDSKRLICPLVGASVTLPDSVVFLETPHVARWDTGGKQWRMDGVIDFSYEEEEAKVSFKMESFQPFVLIQEIYANFPFQSWELRPLGQDSALMTISGALMDLSIMIQGDRCMLQKEEEKRLSHISGKWMSSPSLQRAMLHAGVNIFVNEHTDKYVSACEKDPLTEHAAYEQMALFASACAFSWSKWNAKCGAEHLVMQACEHRGRDPVPEDVWSLYLLGAQRSQKLEITEPSEEFSPDRHPGSEFHSTFIHMLQDGMSPEGIAMTAESSYLFIDTVQSLLCSTRPLIYS